jgi:hypothetical protein
MFLALRMGGSEGVDSDPLRQTRTLEQNRGESAAPAEEVSDPLHFLDAAPACKCLSNAVRFILNVSDDVPREAVEIWER